MPGTLMPVPRHQFFDGNGTPLAGGKLHTFLAGTNTPSPVYQDSALTVPHTNPVTLDGDGRETFFLDDAVSYKINLKTAALVDVWTVDNVFGALSSVLTVTAANVRGLQISRTGADAGLSIQSIGGTGKTYGIVSTPAGALIIRDDADGTPSLTFLGNDITAALTGLFTIAGGLLRVTGFGDHSIAASGNAGHNFGIRNTAVDVAAFASLLVGNDASNALAILQAFSSAYTSSGPNQANGVTLVATGVGGLSIRASHASGQIRFYGGGALTPSITLEAGGGVSIGALTLTPASPPIGTTHNWAIGNASCILFMSGFAAADFTGIAGGVSGRQIWVVTSPASAASLTLRHENAGSLAANRITCATGADIVVTATKAVQMIYDGNSSRWLAFDVK